MIPDIVHDRLREQIEELVLRPAVLGLEAPTRSRLARFLVNPEPVAFMKFEWRAGRLFIGSQDCAKGTPYGGAERWLLVWENVRYARFSLVEGKYPALRASGLCTDDGRAFWKEWSRSPRDLPKALQHAFAGWLFAELQGAKRRRFELAFGRGSE